MSAAASSPRTAEHEIAPVFLERWSPRSFTEATITEAELLGLLEAARWAPSAMNAQPWRFVVALRGEPAFEALAAALMPGNQAWAPKAAALVAIASKTALFMPGAEVETPNGAHSFDAGAAWGYLALQAHMAGWATHAMGGFDRAKAAEAVALPEGFALQTIVAIGKRGPAEALPEALRAREVQSPRRPLNDLVIRGRFGG